MRRELLIAAGPGEWRAALLEGGTLAELYVERGDTRPPGSIQLGRVLRRAPGLDSAFVEVGDPRPGILPVREAAADGIRLDEGARVVVGVRREAQQGKGARLSTRIGSAAGDDIDRVYAAAAATEPPAQLYPTPGLAAALSLRLPGAPDRVLANEPAIVPELRKSWAEAEITVATEWPMDLDAAIDEALLSSLPLPGDGAIHIRESRAATLVDVDTGNPGESSAARGAIAANLEAAARIAEEIRRRNIGGGIVIDFVGLPSRAARERVRLTLAGAFQTDPAEPQVLGWTRLGHLEAVRPRRGRSLADILLEPEDAAPVRKRPLSLAYEALRAVQREARARPEASLRLIAAPAVVTALAGPAGEALSALETRLGRRIAIVESADIRDFDIAAV